jgi:hypothetical protein
MSSVSKSAGVRGLLASMVALVAVSAVADTQAAIFLARRAIGRVEQMSQQSPQPNGAGYDTATVMLEAPADKVFATAVNALRNAGDKGITVTRVDEQQLLVQFTNGQQVAGMKISALGERLSQLLITSAHSGAQQNAAALVSDGVLRVCREMNVQCSRAKQ